LREVLSKIDVGPMLTENEVAATIVDVAYHIHRQLGSGLLESVYHSNMKLTRADFRKPEDLTQSRKAAKKKNANRESRQSSDSTRLPSAESTSPTTDSLRDPFCVFASLREVPSRSAQRCDATKSPDSLRKGKDTHCARTSNMPLRSIRCDGSLPVGMSTWPRFRRSSSERARLRERALGGEGTGSRVVNWCAVDIKSDRRHARACNGHKPHCVSFPSPSCSE
jgi:hypothetical protein